MAVLSDIVAALLLSLIFYFWYWQAMLSEGKVPEEYEFDVGSNIPTRSLPPSTSNTPSKSAVGFGMTYCE